MNGKAMEISCPGSQIDFIFLAKENVTRISFYCVNPRANVNAFNECSIESMRKA
jgi:hypothetical protein